MIYKAKMAAARSAQPDEDGDQDLDMKSTFECLHALDVAIEKGRVRSLAEHVAEWSIHGLIAAMSFLITFSF